MPVEAQTFELTLLSVPTTNSSNSSCILNINTILLNHHTSLSHLRPKPTYKLFHYLQNYSLLGELISIISTIIRSNC
jgi:hypothetical protein